MGKYILKRVLQFIPVFIGVTIILFAMKAIVPGDPISMITGGRAVPEQTRRHSWRILKKRPRVLLAYFNKDKLVRKDWNRVHQILSSRHAQPTPLVGNKHNNTCTLLNYRKKRCQIHFEKQNRVVLNERNKSATETQRPPTHKHHVK